MLVWNATGTSDGHIVASAFVDRAPGAAAGQRPARGHQPPDEEDARDGWRTAPAERAAESRALHSEFVRSRRVANPSLDAFSYVNAQAASGVIASRSS
jgi:hypothetical protein